MSIDRFTSKSPLPAFRGWGWDVRRLFGHSPQPPQLTAADNDGCQLKTIVHKELFHDGLHDRWFRNHPPRRTVLDC
jgi:hypothetical protein